jgi:pimeloyl-ACP methyl ester carboxylesterase
MNSISHGLEVSVRSEQDTVEHLNASGVEYTLYRPDFDTERTIVFYPGVACNRFGNLVENEPKNAVADLVELVASSHNIVFPEVNMPDSGDAEPITGLTIDVQNQKVVEVLSHAQTKLELGHVTYVGQSLGCLAVAQLAHLGGITDSERAVLWGPPTLEGKAHREMLVSKFKHKPQTEVSGEGDGRLQLGDGRLMHVSREFWQSLDDNSLRKHHEAMEKHYKAVIAICASKDNFYPNHQHYLAEHAPTVQRFEIEGTNHTFRPESMRLELKHLMGKLLKIT